VSYQLYSTPQQNRVPSVYIADLTHAASSAHVKYPQQLPLSVITYEYCEASVLPTYSLTCSIALNNYLVLYPKTNASKETLSVINNYILIFTYHLRSGTEYVHLQSFNSI